jgi:Na+-transporting NADH:ubiquinone oxidoreductase subunit D
VTTTTPTSRDLVSRPLLADNPITVQILGICSALAVTKTLATGLAMSAALTFVLTTTSVTISLLRHHIPHSTRLITQIMVIASLVIVTDLFLAAFAPDMSRRLSIFVGLIITNCIVLGRTEGFAMRHGPRASFLDALGNALGYTLVLCSIGAFRELFGAGEILGFEVFALASEGGWFHPVGLLLLPPSAFFLLAFFVWIQRTLAGEPRERSGVTGAAGPERGDRP